MRALAVCARGRHARERAKERENERDRARESEREKETGKKSEREGETDMPEKERNALEKNTQRTAYLCMWCGSVYGRETGQRKREMAEKEENRTAYLQM